MKFMDNCLWNNSPEMKESRAGLYDGEELFADAMHDSPNGALLNMRMVKPLAYRIVKRAFDMVFSAAAITAGVIPGAILSVVVTVDTKSFPIFSQVRAGRGGKPFRIYKFRTMLDGGDELEYILTKEQLAEWRRERKVTDDPRITRLGRFLRATSIDEVPQFVNVLMGQMSVVGPRPVTYDELEHYGDCRELLLSCTPGITGLWQTGPRNEATYESGERQRLDLEYVEHASLALDAKLILKTIAAVVRRTGK